MQTYFIEKGNHRSGLHFSPFIGKSIIKGEFRLNASCWYDPEITKDINKLVGLSGLYHHWNSVRIGWRPASEPGYFELFAYEYRNGQRSFEVAKAYDGSPANIQDATLYNFWLANLQDGMLLSVNYNPVIKGADVSTGDGGLQPFSLGYILHPYFGGNNAAFTDVAIDLDYSLL